MNEVPWPAIGLTWLVLVLATWWLTKTVATALRTWPRPLAVLILAAYAVIVAVVVGLLFHRASGLV